MSRVIPVAVQTMLDQTARPFADCITVTQQAHGSTATIRVTTLNRPLVIGGNTYAPLGFLRKDLNAEDNMGVGTTEAQGILDSAYLTEDDLRAGRWDHAAWTMVRVNYVTPTDGVIQLGSGNLGSVNHGRLRFTAELLSIMQNLQNSIGNLNSALCIHNFGASEGGRGLGNGCTKDLAPFTFTGTAGAMDSDFYSVHDSARTEADAYFSNGNFIVTSGVMDGMQFEIRAYIVGFWVLFTALPYDVTGETYQIIRGCNKSLRQCVDDFSNINDRLASDYTQGNDAAVQVARHN